MGARLVTIPFSHFCEKARWALERSRRPFVEDGHLPLLHWRASYGAGGGRTVPVLVTDDESVLRDSTDILRYADRHGARLATDDAAVMRLEERFDVALGPHTRRLAYFHLLHHPTTVLRWASVGVPRWETRAVNAGFPLARAIMKRGMRIDYEGARRSRAKVDDVWRLVDDTLKDGRAFLCGEAFTAADLTFASLAAPLLFPAEHPYSPRIADLPAGIVAIRDALVDRPAGQHALRMYRDHRGAR